VTEPPMLQVGMKKAVPEFLRAISPKGLAATLGLLFSLTWAGCALGPDYRKPSMELPASWRVAQETEARSGPIPDEGLASWWSVFQDPLLSSLIQGAMEGNLDLLAAETRIRQARASRRASLGALGPQVEASASFRHVRTPVEVPSGPAGEKKLKGIETDQYETGFDASWELDIFGGLRRALEAADADLEAQLEARRDVLVSLAAEVAREYMELRALQERIRVARKNLEVQEHTAEITRKRFEAGFASALDVSNARAQVATTKGQIPVLLALERQTIHRLSLLLGKEPGALVDLLSKPAGLPKLPDLPPLGIPADLLRRRPDIRRAEAQLAAANARIGVAVAELFPKLRLVGGLSFQATDLASWLEWTRRIWSVGPAVSWRIFETGKIRAEIERREALRDEALLAYQQSVLEALKEVEDALSAFLREEEHRKALEEAVKANERSVELALKLYIEGQTDFLNVLQAQRSLYSSEDELIQSLKNSSIQLISLYKALGGGWKEE
jgi:multidrug efflux system outer membrane protein